MSINWNNLRPWDGSQQTAFEEICCQLAAFESPFKKGARFIRKGTPDAGVECYWAAPSGEEAAWQAKFFTTRPDLAQWKQLDDSVETALTKHPQLVRYTICLPIDRADPRITDSNGQQQRWFMDRWNEKVIEWTSWATAKGMSVTFDYWGEHEIFQRLSKDEHQGRYLFWFDKEFLSKNWFKNRLDEAIADAGERYTPELNVELPISQLFDGLGRTNAFFTRLKKLHGEIRKHYKGTLSERTKEAIPEKYSTLELASTSLFELLNSIEIGSIAEIPLDRIIMAAEKMDSANFEYRSTLQEVADRRKKESKQTEKDSVTYSQQNDLSGELYSSRNLGQALHILSNFAGNPEARLANVPALLLCGEAGTGKTHLLCDIAKHRIDRGAPTLLLLGQQFSDVDPWSQILGLLQLSCKAEQFLGALSATGEAAGVRALILIDALNEGEGRRIWKKHLAGFLTLLKKYPWIAVGLSVRTSYEDTVIPDHLGHEQIVRATHVGFAEHEYQASKIFFDAHGIMLPAIPLLNPEFQNPLFLKLFCKGLKSNGWTEIPKGFHGVTAVFNALISAINKKLSSDDFLDFDEKSHVVQKSLSDIANSMSDSGKSWLTRDVCVEVIGKAFPQSTGYEKSLFRHLLSEGILAEDRVYVGKSSISGESERVEVIRFTYERLGDHLIINNLLERHLINDVSESMFAPETPLGKLIEDEFACYRNQGLLEALSIQLPERIGKELTDIVPRIAHFTPVVQSFIHSITWRSLTAFSETTLEYINKHVLRYDQWRYELLDVFLTVSSTLDHPYNADRLHAHLKKFTLSERDAWWSTFLHYQYGDHKAVDRLIDWSIEAENQDNISDEAIFLTTTTLAWFLTSSNRFLRDKATKALVSLLTNRIHVLRDLLKRFLDVNDLYIVERLYAVAYGCALRSTKTQEVVALAKDVYQQVFAGGKPVAHLLVRDYARGTIETALHHVGEIESVETHLIRPPYNSDWPIDFPSEEEIKDLDKKEYEKHSYKNHARWALHFSVTSFGDFSRYIIGTNSNSFFWKNISIDTHQVLTYGEKKSIFEKSLTKDQLELFQKLEDLLYGQYRIEFLSYYQDFDKGEEDSIEDGNETDNSDEHKDDDFDSRENDVLEAETAFIESLDDNKSEEYILLNEEYEKSLKEDKEHDFDLNLAQRWVLKRVYDMGWTPELFAEFDGVINRNRMDRSCHKPERIGKKYQWIAWHEFLALAADNLQVRRRFDNDDWDYAGPWQVHRRDIDPSCLLIETSSVSKNDQSRSAWWSSCHYNAWKQNIDDLQWLQIEEDLPQIDSLIDITNPEDGRNWVSMDASIQWEIPISPVDDRHEVTRRQLWYMLKAYIVRKNEADAFFEWAYEQDFTGCWMPEEGTLHDVFLGEFFWAPAYQYFHNDYYEDGGWHDVSHGAPNQVRIPIIEYSANGDDYDCSIDSGYSITLPAKWLVDEMGLSWQGKEGHFFDKHGTLVAYDPSVREKGRSTLLFRKDILLKFLEENNYEILWTMLGEKLILPGGFSQDYKGELNISGSFKLKDGKLTGKMKQNFKKR